MGEEDRRYLRSVRKMRPSLEVFEKMVEILRDVQEKTDQLLKTRIYLS